MSVNPNVRPPLPPFTRDTAMQKIRGAEDGWAVSSIKRNTGLMNSIDRVLQ